MRLAVISATALVAGAATLAVVSQPAATWTLVAILAAYVALLARGISSVRSSLVEPTVWRTPDPTDRRVALTFDDGPHPEWTPRVLDALRAEGAKATFFVLGSNVRRFPGLVRRIVDEGHEVACHGDTHSPRTAFFRPARMAGEIEACRDAVRAEAGVTPRLFRTPYGVRSPAHVGLARRLDLVVVGMARRGHDKSAGASPAALAARFVGDARPGEILALHDGDEHGATGGTCAAADALPDILRGLAARGIAGVSVGSLLAERPYVESPRRAWTGRTRGGNAGNAIFAGLVRRFGRRPALVLLTFVAAWFAIGPSAARRASVDLRRRVRGRGSWWAESVWVYRHFLVYGRTLVWRLEYLLRGGAPPEIVYDGIERIAPVTDVPGPLFLVSGHIGDWVVAARRIEVRGGRDLSVVAYRGVGIGPHQVRDGSADAAYRLIDVEAPPQKVALEIASALAGGGAVAMHADRVMDDAAAVAVPFLGGEARFPVGVWQAALVTGAPAIVYFAIPETPSRVRFVIYDPIRVRRVPREERESAVRDAAAAYARCLEDCVRRYPLHWANFHDMWSRPA